MFEESTNLLVREFDNLETIVFQENIIVLPNSSSNIDVHPNTEPQIIMGFRLYLNYLKIKTLHVVISKKISNFV